MLAENILRNRQSLMLNDFKQSIAHTVHNLNPYLDFDTSYTTKK